MYAAESRGEVPRGTAARWRRKTPKRKLPERVKSASFVAGLVDGLKRFVTDLSL